jgi:serine/threonine-protein kinase
VETGECDHRGDIYALGIIGYETLVGASPFPSHSTVSKILERFGTPPPPLKQAVPSCPDELAGIIARAMNVRISERYQTASELRQDLERFIENHYFEKRSPHSSMPQGGSRSPDPLVETVRLPSQAHLLKRKPDRIKTLILALGGLLLGMVALAAFYAWKTAPKAPPQEENIQDVRDQILGP